MSALDEIQITTVLWRLVATAGSNNASKYNRYSADNRLSKHNRYSSSTSRSSDRYWTLL